MISYALPLSVGNAVSLLLAPPLSAVAWKVLRKTEDTISGVDDPNAAVVFDGSDKFFIDIATLANGAPYYYQPFYLNAAGAWSTAPSVSVTPSATVGLVGPDPLSLVRQRLEAGLKVEVEAGRLVQDMGYIPCLTAPPTFEGTKFPIVTLHLTMQPQSVFAVGQVLAPDSYDPVADQWSEYDGSIFRVQLQIIAWVVANGDMRIALRRAIAKVLLANMAVFSDQGLTEIEISQSDVEDFDTYESPMFQTITSFTCLAPMAVSDSVGSIHSVTLEADAA